MRSIQEKKVLSSIGVGFLLAGLIIVSILIPTVRSVQQANRQVYELRLYLEKKHYRSVQARSAIKQIEQIKDSMIGLEKYLYKKGDALKLITLLEDLSNRHAVTQKIVSSNLDSPTNVRVAMHLNLTGRYHDILEYLRDLEQSDYFIAINRLYLSSFVDRGQPSAEPQASLDIEFTIYVTN